MKTCLYVAIVHAISAIQCASMATGAAPQGNDTQQLQHLQKQKIEVYNQLNDAVVDTVKALEESNNSLATEGISNLLELLVLMDNGTASEPPARDASAAGASNHTAYTSTANSSKLEDGRRFIQSYKKSKSSHGFDHIKQAILQMGFIKNNVDLNKVKDEKLRNLLAFQAKLDKWIKLREIEKRKIKMEKAKVVGHQLERISETCPDFGEKKSGGDTDLYPCCRKCCKQSYLGCL